MSNMLADVREFVVATRKDATADFGILPDRPCLNSPKAKLCIRLIQEECGKELVGGLRDGDLVAIADGIVDSMYVILFTALYYGIPVDAVWNAVQAAAMSKRWPDGKFHHDAGNKVIKPPGWKHPDIAKILLDAGWMPGERGDE